MCTMGVSNRIARNTRYEKDWEELHFSKQGEEHSGELTKARQMIQETQGEVDCFA